MFMQNLFADFGNTTGRKISAFFSGSQAKQKLCYFKFFNASIISCRISSNIKTENNNEIQRKLEITTQLRPETFLLGLMDKAQEKSDGVLLL